MKTIRLTVNGESRSAGVADRTQLAELLRDHLHLTGTHLGCEHGVCGACTVLLDGKPIRSCITYAHACEGATVVTVEGLGDDSTGRALREAFARHHALQCGFCTPGMLITAWDIVTRLAPVNEAAIRHELSGNLCRCTGYMGIVAAVRDVALQHRSPASDHTDTATSAGVQLADDEAVVAAPAIARGRGSSAPTAMPSDGETNPLATGRRAAGQSPASPVSSVSSASPRSPASPASPQSPASSASHAVAFEPFEIDPGHLADVDSPTTGPAGTGAVRPMTRADGWTAIEREFAMRHPVDALWALFEDLPRVAECLPGVHVESADSDRFSGRAEIRFGPVGAAFHGGGTRETDAERRTGVISGRGSDARGHATLDAELRYAMSGDETHGPEPRTRVEVGIRFRIQGGLAQFNRGDLVESFADAMLAEFVRNCDRRLAGEEIPRGGGAGGFALLWRMIRARLGL